MLWVPAKVGLTEAGSKAAVAPAGRPVTVSATGSEKVPVDAAIIANVAEAPWATLLACCGADTVNVPLATTGTGVVTLSLPPPQPAKPIPASASVKQIIRYRISFPSGSARHGALPYRH